MDTKKLRQKILDLAIHGKLVPQDPNDEPASVLLERIRAEKETLIKEGKIKRAKKTTTSSDTSHYENVPFEVPQGWCWTTLGEVITLKSGTNIKVRDCDSIGEYPIYGGNGINGSFDNYNVECNTIIVGRVGFYCGSVNITTTRAWVTDNALIVNHVDVFDVHYLLNLLRYLDLGKNSNSTAQPVVSGKGILPLLVPVPPIAEQKRIVSEIERINNLIDVIGAGKNALETTISQTKSKILDLAIHGKLVPQDLNDEPASELLKRINPKAIVSCDNPHYEQVPFEIPSNWVWATLGDITNYGKCSTVPVDDIDEESWVLELEDIEKDSAKVIKLCTKSDRDIKGVRHSFLQGYVLYSKLRTYLNKVLVANKDGFCTTEIIPIKCSDSIYPEYLCHVLRSKYFLDYTAQCGYGVKMPRLSTTDARKALVPLPPYEEQINISAKIKELYCSLDYIAETSA